VPAFRGELIVVGREPDGDSIRFRPADTAALDVLAGAARLKRSREDGSVALRLDTVDAPELHFGGHRQPLGGEARDALLAEAGFTGVVVAGTVVRAATPERVAAVVEAEHVEPNGRVVARVGDVNTRLLRTGAVYAMAYASTPEPVREALRAAAAAARDDGLGVWTRDATAAFALPDQAAIGPHGALVLPKLFRRCTEWLRTRRPGEGLVDWLRRPDRPAPLDDEALLDGARVRLSDLIEQEGDAVRFLADPLALTFLA
jgi:endonuclease YncB( thermonuclease family)